MEKNRSVYRLYKTNDSMVPTKLSIYFTKKHGHLSIRIPAYVKILLDSKIHQSSTVTKQLSLTKQMQ